jgi:hypothetical protein
MGPVMGNGNSFHIAVQWWLFDGEPGAGPSFDGKPGAGLRFELGSVDSKPLDVVDFSLTPLLNPSAQSSICNPLQTVRAPSPSISRQIPR